MRDQSIACADHPATTKAPNAARNLSRLMGIMLALALAFIMPAIPASAVEDPRVPPSLVSFERISPDPIHLSGATTYRWKSAGATPSTISIVLQDALGYSINASASPRGATEGTISVHIPYGSFPGRHKVLMVSIGSGDKSVSYYHGGSIMKYPYGLDEPLPSSINFPSLGFTSEKMNLLSYANPEIGGEIAETPLVDVGMGTKLTALHPGWGPLPLTFTYQWWRNEEKIVGATAATYTVQPGDLGTSLRIAVTASKHDYVTATEFSQYHTVVPAILYASTPTIAGSAVLGSTLVANPGVWGPAPVNLSYQWLRRGTPIVGATGSTYTLTDADAGKPITVRVTGAKQSHETVSRTSKATSEVTLRQFNPQVPKISGTVKVGSTLTAAPGVWDPAPVTFRYWWTRDGMEIPGATGSTYKLTADDHGTTISVMVEGSKAGYDHFPMTSNPTTKVAAGTLTAPVPTISGTLKIDEHLTANPGTWGPGPVDLRYQWYRNGVATPYTQDSSYYLTPRDVGQTISVSVTGTKAGYGSITKTSVVTSPVEQPWMTSQTPTISGTAKVGHALTAAIPSPPSSVYHVTYQWYRSGAAIKGAVEPRYMLTPVDAGKSLTVKAIGLEGGYESTSAVSAPTANVAHGSLKAPVPTVTGTTKVGHTLKANAGTWTTGTTLKYQWYRSGAAIKGATKTSYSLGAADAGKLMTVKVTGSKTGYAAAVKNSKATAAVAKATLRSSTPTISGTTKVGHRLKANANTWTSGTVLKYQWYRSGTAIKGATKTSYSLGSADAGRRMTVKVTGSKAGYATSSKTSKRTAAIAKGTLRASTPKVTGTTKVGRKLYANAGTWTSGTKLTYQWYRGGSVIKGATGKTYTMANSTRRHAIKVKVTGSKAGYVSVAKTSKSTTRVR